MPTTQPTIKTGKLSKRGRLSEGAPTIKTPELTNKIFSEISKGKSLRSVEKKLRVDVETIWKWIRSDAEFGKRYAQAKMESSDAFAEDIIYIATHEIDNIDFHDLDGRTANARVQAKKVKMDALKWIASKLKPKVYGEKIETEHTGHIGFTVQRIDYAPLLKPKKEIE